jgi:hypothetical protein
MDKNKTPNLPAVLVMRRKAVRQYPNGQMVAMYYVDKLNKYIAIPYDTSDAIIKAEEIK